MKLSPFKFSVALGFALSSSFIFCNIILAILGTEITLQILNSLFHEIDFKPLLLDNGFMPGKLLHGTLMLFVAGTLIGFITAFIYNLLNKVKFATSAVDSEKQQEKVIIIQGTTDESTEVNEPKDSHQIGFKR